eukprot:11664848-Prorocentrum_lima.AAC.1
MLRHAGLYQERHGAWQALRGCRNLSTVPDLVTLESQLFRRGPGKDDSGGLHCYAGDLGRPAARTGCGQGAGEFGKAVSTRRRRAFLAREGTSRS